MSNLTLSLGTYMEPGTKIISEKDIHFVLFLTQTQNTALEVLEYNAWVLWTTFMVFFGPVWSLTAPGDFELSLYDNSFLKNFYFWILQKKRSSICVWNDMMVCKQWQNLKFFWINYSFNLPMHRVPFQVMWRCPQANNDSQNLYQWRNGLSEMSAVSWGFCVWHAPHGASINHALFSRSLSGSVSCTRSSARLHRLWLGWFNIDSHRLYSTDTRFWPFVEVFFFHWSRSPHDTWQNE